MASNSWHRPTSVPYPSTWSKFTKKMNNGTYADFEIKDITKELASECIQFMKTYFISDEPFYTSLGKLTIRINLNFNFN